MGTRMPARNPVPLDFASIPKHSTLKSAPDRMYQCSILLYIIMYAVTVVQFATEVRVNPCQWKHLPV
jgi:hypothetical protein